MRTIFLLLCTAALTAAQIQVNWSILPPANKPAVDLSNIGQAAAAQGATGIVSVQQTEEKQLSAQQCQPGTYSQRSGASQSCTPCPAGTASTAVGASDPSTCIPCATGAYSATGSSVCTDCIADTFSVTVRATNPGVCLQCPPDATSPTRSSNVDMCICDPGNFLSDNVMRAFPYDAVPVEMSLVGATGIDIPHVTC
jgi:hypothetical protein